MLDHSPGHFSQFQSFGGTEMNMRKSLLLLVGVVLMIGLAASLLLLANGRIAGISGIT